MRYWPPIALGLGIVALIALVLPLVQSQRHLSVVRAELGRTNGQLVQATGIISDLKAELNSAAAEREASQSRIEALSNAADDAKAKLSAAEKQIADLKEQLESVNGELAKSKDATEQANAKADDAANTAKTRQGELDQANAEIEQLKTELDQRPLPPVSVSPPGENSSTPQ